MSRFTHTHGLANDCLRLRNTNYNDPLKGLERRGLVPIDVDTEEAAEALTRMLGAPATPVSPIRRSNIDSDGKDTRHGICQEAQRIPCSSKRLSTQKTTGCKKKRPVLLEEVELVCDRAPEACIYCPVCSQSLPFLALDTDLNEPLRNKILCKYMNQHSELHHPFEPLWNSLPGVDFEYLDSESIMRNGSDSQAVMALIAKCLAIAANSLRIPKGIIWAESWLRVKALTLARIGSAHCSAVNAKLYPCQGSRTETMEKEQQRETWIKREARRYLSALIVSVQSTPPCEFWRDGSSELRRRNYVQAFCFANHRHIGFFHHSLLPRAPTPYRGINDDLDLWQSPAPIWHAPFYLDSDCLDTESITRKGSDAQAVKALVVQCLSIAARSLPKPKGSKWTACWLRVKALTLARLGSVYCSTVNADLYAWQGAISTSDEELIKRAAWIKVEAVAYISSLLGAVAATPPPSSSSPDFEHGYTVLFDEFFLDGANHRKLGLIHPDFLPESPYFKDSAIDSSDASRSLD